MSDEMAFKCVPDEEEMLSLDISVEEAIKFVQEFFDLSIKEASKRFFDRLNISQAIMKKMIADINGITHEGNVIDGCIGIPIEDLSSLNYAVSFAAAIMRVQLLQSKQEEKK